MEAEEKKYGPDSTPEEIEMLLSRVYLIDDKIVYYNEPPMLDLFQMELMWNKAKQLFKESGAKYFLVNLVGCQRPDSEQRDFLRKEFKEMGERIEHVSCYTERNFLTNMMAKFVVGGTSDKTSMHRTKEEAMKAFKL